MADPMVNRPSKLVSELKQTKPFPSLTQEALVGIARSASMVDRAVARLTAPYGLSTAQYNVLRILRGAGPDGMATLAIRERLIDPAAAITRLVDKLDRAGLLERERTSSDRRCIVCRITAQGLAVLAELDPQLQGIDARLSAVLEPAEVSRLIELLDRVREGL
ncbi:MAG: MarR family transcriptional regulator [Gemmatimonadales bacterium]|nr:MarR family transcriptional regulator [Gemmatimonadales bacterium]